MSTKSVLFGSFCFLVFALTGMVACSSENKDQPPKSSNIASRDPKSPNFEDKGGGHYIIRIPEGSPGAMTKNWKIKPGQKYKVVLADEDSAWLKERELSPHVAFVVPEGGGSKDAVINSSEAQTYDGQAEAVIWVQFKKKGIPSDALTGVPYIQFDVYIF